MEPLPDHLRCKRTDGRQWRCNRRVMEDKKLCEIHHLQGRHRQYRTKVPETLKLQRRKSKKLAASNSNFDTLVRVSSKDGRLGKFKKKGKKMKRGDLQLDLIRMVLQREVEKRKNKKKKGSLEKDTVNNDDVNHNVNNCSGGESEEDGEELMRDLPNGFMAISPAKNFGNGNVGSCSSSHCDVKIGVDGFNGIGSITRCFRSKNIEPMPIGKLQVLPYKRNAEGLRKGKKKKCHWCRRGGLRTLIRCLSCRKELYCLDCIKEQYFDTQEEVQTKCPVCRSTCSCKACSAIQCRDIECKDLSKEKSEVNKVLHFHYLICMLLPVLKQINQDQSVEIEIEAKIKGQKPSEVQIHQGEVSCNKPCICNHCKTSIVDFHRRCPYCSYYLCLNCCRDIFHGSLNGSIRALLFKSNGRKSCVSGQKLSNMKSLCTSKLSYASKNLRSSLSPCQSAADGKCGIPCPPREFGGCGGGLLDLCCIFPLSWTKELEISAEELVGCYELPENLDINSCCSLCLGMDCETNGIEQLQEAAARKGSTDNLLYYPSVMDIRGDNLEHFQKHWGRGQPVIVRNVLQSASDLSWDPIILFCTYLKNNAGRSQNEQATQCLDWFEVEIGIRQLFLGSYMARTNSNVWHEKLKLKGWLSSRLFQEHFPAHYTEILHALPLPEYMDPMSGVLNIAAELQEALKPDLGPCVFISYGSGENLAQADSATKLRYNSYDMVNILAHTTDIPVSTKQLNYIRKLMTKNKEQNKETGEAPLDKEDIDVGLHDMFREDMQVNKKVARVSWFSAASREVRASDLKDSVMFHDGEYDSDSDTDTDTEVSKFFFDSVKSSRTSDNLRYTGRHTEDCSHYGMKKLPQSCGAQWDVFRRQDVPKLLEYLRRHSNEFTHTHGFQKHALHPILDENFFLDATHKMRLKEEFQIEPWTFEQHVGEAVIIPAGCPYQIRNLKSCVSVVLDFISPENVTECISLIDELRRLPENHKAKVDSLEVKKIALHSIGRAVKEIHGLTSAKILCGTV